MGIDWDWIYQRPQIIEQNLEKSYNVTVIFPRSILKAKNKLNKNLPKLYKILWTIPFQEKYRMIGWIASLLQRNIFKNINQYDAIFIGYPLYYRYISKKYGGKIIYDCMDNHEALYPDAKSVKKMIIQEKLLVKDCDCIIVTSKKLKSKIDNMKYPDKTILVRNGFDFNSLLDLKKADKKNKYLVGYFGTLADWFDYDLLFNCLDKFTNIEYHLVGPLLKEYKNSHKRIIYEGIIPHNNLVDFFRDFDCLIMPFIINDVVEWVDPVKLYEYVAMGKCIVSVYYQEISLFGDFVYFYNDSKEFDSIMKDLIKRGFPPKYTRERQIGFLRENSWSVRLQKIDGILNSLLNEKEVNNNGNQGDECIWN